ncbi:YafY family transcriptional regulator [Saccharopolyspora sp. K220]|uniref:helix-turn-helix transcriptional regulator n=1 Tax=Saccharopolyspora soli TaxID=2926618 RepID=UPI001F5660E7|nr:YafY family protein [Saccharopolyspora soli]MCI2423532.1 YafY family transcriptional regulator [Saccharopolyspora soli]
MLETSARLLRLLSLLQARRDWSGAGLAERLGVTTRTVRADVERLRSLGYPVHATPGVAGGYRLGAGAALPPLLLDDDEAVAVAIGLRTAASGTVSGIEETSIRALAKLEQVLPARLRQRVNALQTYTVPVSGGGPVIDADVLTVISRACRDRERLRFDYRDHDSAASMRDVEPHRLVSTGRRWYLVGWDCDRGDWRSFRVDRLAARTPTGPRFAPHEPPQGGFAEYVARGVSAALWAYRARVRVHASAEVVVQRVPPTTWLVSAIDEETCLVDAGADTPQLLAVYLGALDLDFDVIDAPELAAATRLLADRYARAAGGRHHAPLRAGSTGQSGSDQCHRRR